MLAIAGEDFAVVGIVLEIDHEKTRSAGYRLVDEPKRLMMAR